MVAAAENAAENAVLVAEQSSVKKRLNGCTASAEPSPTPADPNDFKGSHARDSLGSRAAVSETAATFGLEIESAAESDAEPDYASFDVPGADPSDDVEPFVVVSTPEHVEAATAFFEAAKAKETDAQKKRARTQSQVFSVMQYLNNPETGEPMTSQEHIDAGLEALKDRIYRYAYVWHLRDRVVDVDEGTGEPFCCGVKGAHWHMVIWCHRGDGDAASRPTIRTVSDAFAVPSAKVKTPREAASRDGGQYKGANAAEKAFFDLVEYLPHETRRADGLRGIAQSERFYLVDKSQETKPGKYQYGRGRVVANFDFSKDLDSHMAGRASAADNGMGLKARKTKLRRAVMDGMTLAEAREKDRDAYADDLPRLRDLAREYQELNPPPVGVAYRKASVLVHGERRGGKDILTAEIAKVLVALAAKAGQEWNVVKPGGEHSTEAVAGRRSGQRADVVVHEDARYYWVRSYDEALRYLDPNNAAETTARNANLPAVGPHAVMLTTSSLPTELALTMKARKSSEELAISNMSTRYPAVDVDEFLLRLGFVVEVEKLPELTDPHDPANKQTILDRAPVSISRVVEEPGARSDDVRTRSGAVLGKIHTSHRLEPLAVIAGARRAARFIAMEIIERYSADISEGLADEIAGYASERTAIASETALALADRARAVEEEMVRRADSLGAACRDHFVASHLAGRDTPDPSGNLFAMTNGEIICSFCRLPATAPRPVSTVNPWG